MNRHAHKHSISDYQGDLDPNVPIEPFRHLYTLLEELSQPPFQIIVRGDRAALESWRTRILPRLRIDRSAYFIPDGTGDLPDALAQKSADRTGAWLAANP